MLVLRGASGGAYSPDGRSLAYVDAERVKVADADGRNSRVLSESGGTPRWSPDGTRIVYLDGDGSIYVVDVATGDTALVARGDWPEWVDNDTLIIAPQ